MQVDSLSSEPSGKPNIYEKTSHFQYGIQAPTIASKESACSAEDLGSILGLGRSPGEGKGYPLQCSVWRMPWTIQSMVLQKVRHSWLYSLTIAQKNHCDLTLPTGQHNFTVSPYSHLSSRNSEPPAPWRMSFLQDTLKVSFTFITLYMPLLLHGMLSLACFLA